MKGLNLRKPFTETPSSVRKEYDAQIEAFLQGFEDRPRSSIFGPGPLDLLFEYTKRASNLSKQYQGEKDKETIARRKAEEMVANLQKDVRHLGKKGDNLRAQVEERDEWMTGLAKQHSKEEEKWRQQKEAMTRAHIEEKNKLISQLLVNSDDSQGWADEKLKVKFQDLQRQIEKIASPNRKEFRLATGQILDTKIDPTGFVQRSGPGRLHLLLKSLLWNVYREQLFSAPFGFGVLGQGDGKQKLLDLISSWRSLVDPNGLRCESSAAQSDVVNT
jgi:Tfp pilus assembly protein FimV